jgi:hypothetical protein
MANGEMSASAAEECKCMKKYDQDFILRRILCADFVTVDI